MIRNSFGHIFTLTTFGESHGEAIGGVVDGMPAGIEIDLGFIQKELNRRKPGQSKVTTQRHESDTVTLLSGVFEGKSTGAPIGFVVYNKDQHSNDYDNMRHIFRPSHADYTFYNKYSIRDHRGGGRASARITIARCVGGALAKLALKQLNISIQAFVSQIGNIRLENDYRQYNLSETEKNIVRCPDKEKAREMEDLILKVKADGDTIGGVVSCVIKGCPPGLGEPEFDKLHAQLGAAMLSINAVKGFEYGGGFDSVTARGSEQNDVFIPRAEDVKLSEKGNSAPHITMENDGETVAQSALVEACGTDIPTKNKYETLETSPTTEACAPNITTETNHSGGIQGGISNGQDIYFKVAFKPVATLLKQQKTVDLQGHSTLFTARGRHDPCVLPRAVPIVEAMAAMVILDNFLLNKTTKL